LSSLAAAFEEAKTLGLLSANLDIGLLIEHSQAFGEICAYFSPGPNPLIIDLGCGIGIPSLILAKSYSDWQITAVDSNHRKIGFFKRWAIQEEISVKTIAARVEDLLDNPEFTQGFDLVIGRKFGPLATFLELGCGFLRKNGVLITSVSPSFKLGPTESQKCLDTLGLQKLETPKHFDYSFIALKKLHMPQPGFPRKFKEIFNKPLFHVKQQKDKV
jgi:16S rRNA G527 N7-methylase RsmG